MLNYDLARKLNRSPEEVEKIEKQQAFRTLLGKQYKDGVISAGEYREEWEHNEYILQELWGFSLNPNYHMFWEMEGCTCPKYDNLDAYPYGYYVMNAECPIHGG